MRWNRDRFNRPGRRTLTLAGYLFMDQILNLFGVTEASYPYAKEYMEVILLGVPFYMFTSGMNSPIRGMGPRDTP